MEATDASDTKFTRTDGSACGTGPIKSMSTKFHVSHDRTCSEDEHERDDGRRDDDGAADVANGRARFAGENRDIFETTESPQRHLAENIQAEKGCGGHRPLDRPILWKFSRRAREEGQRN